MGVDAGGAGVSRGGVASAQVHLPAMLERKIRVPCASSDAAHPNVGLLAKPRLGLLC